MVLEEWRPVNGWERLYEVSSCGRVRSLDREVTQENNGGTVYTRMYRGKLLGSSRSRDGYARVLLQDADRRERHLVHTLVAAAFLGRCPVGQECCHRDGRDNTLSNLRYDTHRAACRTKLTLAAVNAIRSRAAAATTAQLAREYGVTAANIRAVVRRKTWV